MFERFTDRARRIVVLAQEEARLLNHNYIGTEHLVLGLVSEGEGIAAQALAKLDIKLADLRTDIEAIIGRGQHPPAGHIPFTPRAKKCLELSLREALQLGHNYIGTEHLILGVIREGEGVGCQVLEARGADLGNIRKAVIELLSQPVKDLPKKDRPPYVRPIPTLQAQIEARLDIASEAIVAANKFLKRLIEEQDAKYYQLTKDDSEEWGEEE